MATAPVTQPVSESLKSQSWALGLGLIWGGALLFILGLWLGIKHEEISRLPIFALWALGAIGIALGIWHIVILIRDMPGEQKKTVLEKQRTLAGFFVLLGGAALVILGAVLGWIYKLDVFGEAIGMGILGIVSIAGGRYLLAAPKAAQSNFFDALRARHQGLSMGLLLGGAIATLVALYFIILQKPGWAWFPELGALLLLGVLGVVFGLVLFSSAASELTASFMRSFVLAYGGLAGLILSLAALAAAWVWREDVFMKGLAGWQGPNAYQFWLCAYVELAGLGLMFGSFLLARGEIHVSAVLRRVLFGYNTVLTGLLLLATLVALNIVLFTALPYSFDWSQTRGLYDLSPSTKGLLNSLRQPTTIYVLISQERLSTQLKNLLDNCQAHTSKLQVIPISPDKDFVAFEDLAERFPEIVPKGRRGLGDETGRGILVVYGELPADKKAKVPHAFLPVSRLAKQERERSGVKLYFKGEAELMKELNFLVQGQQKRTVYFLQGDEELDINEQQPFVRQNLVLPMEELGCGTFKDRLTKDNYVVKGLHFGKEPPGDKGGDIVYVKEMGPEKRKDVPDDADAVIIAGPSKTLSNETLEALDRYMDRAGRKAGKLLVFLDIVLDNKGQAIQTSGLEEFLGKYGVKVGTSFPLRAIEQRADDPRTVLATVPRDSKHELAKPFAANVLPLKTARVVRPDAASNRYKGEVLLELVSRQEVWEETNVRGLTNPIAYFVELSRAGLLENRLSREPIPVAVAVSEEGSKPRLVVFGDTEFVSNAFMMEAKMVRNDLSYALSASALQWLAEKEGLIGARAKETTSYTLNPDQVNVARLSLLPGWLMVAGVLGLGAGIWIVRRR